ncbi:hypothetical protein D3C78_1346810 [compost metagenome]
MGEEQHVRDDAGDPLQLLDAGRQDRLVFVDGAFPRKGHLCLAHQVADGSTQLVGKIVGELRQLLHAAVEAVQHDVEAVRQFAQFPRQLTELDAVGQVLGGNARGDPAELAHGCQSAADDPPCARSDQ